MTNTCVTLVTIQLQPVFGEARRKLTNKIDETKNQVEKHSYYKKNIERFFLVCATFLYLHQQGATLTTQTRCNLAAVHCLTPYTELWTLAVCEGLHLKHYMCHFFLSPQQWAQWFAALLFFTQQESWLEVLTIRSVYGERVTTKHLIDKRKFIIGSASACQQVFTQP